MAITGYGNKAGNFVVTTVLLVPFVYGFSVVPDTCALPQDPKWDKQGDCWYPEKDKNIMICCWERPDAKNPGETETACQTCDTSTNPKDCGDVVVTTLNPSSDITGKPEGFYKSQPIQWPIRKLARKVAFY